MTQTLTPLEARILFREHYGEFSDSMWYRLKANIFNNDFPLTRENVIYIATIKRMLPRFNISKFDIVSTVKQVSMLTSTLTVIKGKEILEMFDKYEINVHKNTITKWFKDIGGFSKTRTYLISELTPILLAAFVYKLRTTL
jgi:hypothetical protein